MSNEEEKNINTTPSQQTKKATGFLWKCLVIASLSGFVVCLSAIGYLLMLHYNLTGSIGYNSPNRINTLETNFSALQKNSALQEDAIHTLTESDAAMKKIIEENLPGFIQQKAPWLAAQTHYLIGLANVALQQERNTASAIAYLTIASDTIANLTETPYENTRRAITADIETLQQLQPVDTSAIYQRLIDVDKKIASLPVITQPTQAFNKNNSKEPVTPWQQGLANTWQQLKQVVIVRHQQSKSLPLVSPEQEIYVYQNLHTIVLQTMSALLQGENAIYQQSLSHAIEWIKTYCVNDNANAQQVIAELNALKEINIHPILPTISQSIQAAGELPT